jgi:hypothetical protein
VSVLRLGKGSVFSVDVPLASQALQTEKLLPSHDAVGSQRRLAVLFIEDDSSVADSLSMLFGSYGIERVGAGDGDEAIARLEGGFRPDL